MAIIAVDMDDVIVDFMEGVRHAVETEYGIDVGAWDKWEMGEQLNAIIGKSWWKWMRARDWLWPNFPAIPGAIGGIAQLRAAGHYMEIVTSKPEWAEFAVWKWLGKWRPPVNRVTIVDTDKGERKVDMTDADAIIDDRAQAVNEFCEEDRLGFLFDRPHNQDVVLHPDAIRVYGWPKTVEVVLMELSVNA